jgi:hypothetical protein
VTAPQQLAPKLRNTCTLLRDDGLSFRPILKRADERSGRRGLVSSAGVAGKLA